MKEKFKKKCKSKTPGLNSRHESPIFPRSEPKTTKPKRKKNKMKSVILHGKAIQMKYTNYEETLAKNELEPCLKSFAISHVFKESQNCREVKTIYNNIPQDQIIIEEKLNKDLEFSKEKLNIKKENKVSPEDVIIKSKFNNPTEPKSSCTTKASSQKREIFDLRPSSPKECYIYTGAKKADASSQY